jgi:hypothetical protein
MMVHKERAGHSSHAAALRHLAREWPVPLEDLQQIYDIELIKLETGAHISTYIHVCALRHVREIVRQRCYDLRLSCEPSNARNAPAKFSGQASLSVKNAFGLKTAV